MRREKELAELVPWNLWRTRLDRLAAFSPFEMLEYYFIRHTTGPSLAYTIFYMFALAIYVSIVVFRCVGTRDQL